MERDNHAQRERMETDPQTANNIAVAVVCWLAVIVCWLGAL